MCLLAQCMWQPVLDLKAAGLVRTPKHYITLQLNRGDRINGRGLELEMTMRNFPKNAPGTSVDMPSLQLQPPLRP